MAVIFFVNINYISKGERILQTANYNDFLFYITQLPPCDFEIFSRTVFFPNSRHIRFEYLRHTCILDMNVYYNVKQ